jgi:hypothetical protein
LETIDADALRDLFVAESLERKQDDASSLSETLWHRLGFGELGEQACLPLRDYDFGCIPWHGFHPWKMDKAGRLTKRSLQ